VKLTLAASIVLFALGAGALFGLDVLLARALGVRP